LIEFCDVFERLVLGLSDLIEFCDVFLLILLERNGEGCLGLPSGIFLAFLGEGDIDLWEPVVLIGVCDVFWFICLGLPSGVFVAEPRILGEGDNELVSAVLRGLFLTALCVPDEFLAALFGDRDLLFFLVVFFFILVGVPDGASFISDLLGAGDLAAFFFFFFALAGFPTSPMTSSSGGIDEPSSFSLDVMPDALLTLFFLSVAI
jgi:hypothetical protein